MEQTLDFGSTWSIWEYVVFGMDLSDATHHEMYALNKAINDITNDFNTNSTNIFDTSQ